MAVHVSIISPVLSLEYIVITSDEFTVGGSVTLPKLKLNPEVIVLPLRLLKVITVYSGEVW